ncbi:MAG: P1 family peptidase [Pseudomonadota bacterium]
MDRWDFDRDLSIGVPVVTETWSGALEDYAGFHIEDEDIYRAIDGAKDGSVPQGAVRGGTAHGKAVYCGASPEQARASDARG